MGLTMDGNLGLLWIQQALEHLGCAKGKSAVAANRAQLVFGNGYFIQDQRPELRVAALLNDIAVFMILDKRRDLIREWEPADPHIAGNCAIPAQEVESLTNRPVAATYCDETEAGVGAVTR